MHWIPCNLPWSSRPSSQKVEMPPLPTAPAERVKEKFGTTRDELAHRLDRLQWRPENGEQVPIESLPEAVQQQLLEGEQLLNEIRVWEFQQPEWLNYQQMCTRVLEEAAVSEQQALAATFVGRGLNFPGVLIELDSGERVLLGHTDEEGKRSGNPLIAPEEIVVRYLVLDVPGLERMTDDVALQLQFRAANDFEQHCKLPEAFEERWWETSGMAACVRLGFRPCDDNTVAAAAAREALTLYLSAYTRVRDLTADGTPRK